MPTDLNDRQRIGNASAVQILLRKSAIRSSGPVRPPVFSLALPAVH
jgi:hypothetical protein